jgi:hypothetical protein
VRRFLERPLAAIARNHGFVLSWPAGGPWT